MLPLQLIQLISWLSKNHLQNQQQNIETTTTIRIRKKNQKNLCLDKSYHSKEVEQEITKRGYVPHIRHRRDERNITIDILQKDGL
jgi:hypothetical protein